MTRYNSLGSFILPVLGELVERPDYRLDSRTIKRVQELSTLKVRDATIAQILFGLILDFLLLRPRFKICRISLEAGLTDGVCPD